MKNKLYKKLSVLTLSLLVALVFAACTPEIHIHTDNNSSEASTTSESDTASSSENKTSQDATASKTETEVASSESAKVDTPKKEDSTSSKATSSKATSSKAASSNGNISKSKAKSIALQDAGLKASQIYDYEIELERDNGVLHYEVSFEYNGKDYDYEIDAKTGKILSVEKPNATASEAKISKSKAKNIALKHAGVNASDISFYEIELEKDDGIWKYEISFNKGNVEYEYTINAENGKILHSEKDIDD